MKQTIFFISILLFSACSNINDPLPDFETETIDGKTISDKDYEGKILIINIWATWCGSCIQEIPELNKVVEHYRDDPDIKFLAITDESKKKVNRLLGQQPFAYEQVAEAKLLKHKLHPGLVKSIPFHIIIGKDGETKFEFTGSQPNMKDFLIEQIEKAKKD